jgi:retron-type reverse transcriptase
MVCQWRRKLSQNSGTFQFKPGRRIMIPKSKGGERPLTIAPPRDKLVQEVMRMILEIIFEPTFSVFPRARGPGFENYFLTKNKKFKKNKKLFFD